jgi:hypothetical protein
MLAGVLTTDGMVTPVGFEPFGAIPANPDCAPGVPAQVSSTQGARHSQFGTRSLGSRSTVQGARAHKMMTRSSGVIMMFGVKINAVRSGLSS